MSETIRLSVTNARRFLSDETRAAAISIDALDLYAGHTYALCGNSGIGKTTALEMLSLAKRPDRVDEFRMTLPDQTVIDLTSHNDLAFDDWETRGQYFGYVVQSNRLFNYLTVIENVVLPQRLAGGNLDRRFADELLHTLELSRLANASPSKLSGGERQRVCVARALAHRPLVVLADEPVSSVDGDLADVMIGLLKRYARQNNAAVLVVTHNRDIVRQAALPLLSVDSYTVDATLTTTIGNPVWAADATRVGGS